MYETRTQSGQLKESVHVEDLYIDGSVIIECNLSHKVCNAKKRFNLQIITK